MPLDEHNIGSALREAAEMYGVEAGPLLQAGTRRGLRLRRRQRIALTSGAALALALAGAGLGYGTDLLRSPDVPASPRPVGGAAGMSGRQIVDLLTGLLPHGKITQTAETGAGAGRPTLVDPHVWGVFDDGHGRAQIDFSVARANVAPTDSAASCGATSATYHCTRTLRPDGSSLSLTTETGKPGTPGGSGLTMRAADLITPSGYEVRLFVSNSASALMPPPAADDSRAPVSNAPSSPPPATTRPEPPLDAAQLTAVVTDPGWTRLFAAMRSARPDHQLAPAQVAAIAKPLLPAHATPADAANQEGLTAFHLDSPEHTLSITALRWPGDEARREVISSLYPDTRQLPDGTLIHTEQQKQRMLVRVLHPDGMSVEVIQVSLDGNGTRPGPLTTAQLQAIAASTAWDRPAPNAPAAPSAGR